jgi:hypothetical protein
VNTSEGGRNEAILTDIAGPKPPLTGAKRMTTASLPRISCHFGIDYSSIVGIMEKEE